MEMPWYPENKKIPTGYPAESFVFEPLLTKHVDIDYDAVMESQIHLRAWSQSDWPKDNFTKYNNWQDLARHQREHNEREAFTFTIVDTEKSTCLGCIYINPLDNVLQQLSNGQKAAQVTHWVRSSIVGTDLEEKISKSLVSWLKREWKFATVFHLTSVNSEQYQLFERIGLAKRTTLTTEVPRPGTWMIYT